MALVKYNNNSISAVTSTGLASGALTHIKTLTASSSATLSFVHGTDGVVLDSTYPIYKFEFINIHPATDSAALSFQASTDGGSNYNTTITSTFFRAYHTENGLETGLSYNTSRDLAQSTSFQTIEVCGNENDECTSGELFLYSPSSTTFVKHFMCNADVNNPSQYNMTTKVAGYFNTTSAINAFQFKQSSGNFDGKIKLYGIKDS